MTLTGHVASHAEKVAAEQMAQRVRGVHAIAQEIEARYPEDKKTSDYDIVKRAVQISAWHAAMPEGASR